MARTPEPHEIERAQQQTGQILGAKTADQMRQGKSFVPDSRVGVLPEKVWEKHKPEESK